MTETFYAVYFDIAEPILALTEHNQAALYLRKEDADEAARVIQGRVGIQTRVEKVEVRGLN